ncbi:MAG: TolC family protein [Simkaniaceae bacterium]
MKKAIGLLWAGLLACGCQHVKTDPSPEFAEVQENVDARSGRKISWNRNFDDKILRHHLQKILSKPLAEEDVIYITLMNNPRLQAVYEGLGIAKAELVQASLLKNPIFSFSYRFAFGTGNQNIIDMSFLQNLLDILFIPLKKKIAGKELDSAKAMAAGKVLETIAEAKAALYHLQALEEVLSLKKNILLAREAAYEMSHRLFRAGNIRKLDLLNFKAPYQQMKIDVANLETEVLDARENLHVLMGLWGRQIYWELQGLLPNIPKEKPDLSQLTRMAVANSYALQMARNELDIIKAKYGIKTAQFVIPAMEAGASAEREEGFWSLGPAFALGIPIFDAGKASSAKGQAELHQKWNEYTDLAIKIRSAARRSEYHLCNAYRKGRFYQKVLLPLAEEQLQQNFLQYNAMQVGVFQLLEAKQRELEEKIRAVFLEREYWTAKARLDLLKNGGRPVLPPQTDMP